MANSGALPTLSATGQLEALYIGWFGRAADAAGFQYWMTNDLTQILQGASVSAAALNISKSFALSVENSPYAALASLTTPVNPTAAQSALAASFINQTYQNLFNHQADVAGQQYWQSVFFSGQVPFSALVYDIAQGAQAADNIAINSKIQAGSYFTTANASASGVAGGKAAVVNVVNKTTELASQAATDVISGGSHNQITYSQILGPGNFVTGVRGELNGQVVLTGSQLTGSGADTVGMLYVGPLNDTTLGSKYLLNPVIPGETVTTATFYGPNSSIFDPTIGAGNVRAVGSYQYTQTPTGTFNHGMLYQGPPSGAGGTWTQTDVPSNGVNVVGGTVVGQVANTISHSTMGSLVVGNYDLTGTSTPILPASSNAYIYNIVSQQWTLMNVSGSMTNQTTLYGVWQNGGPNSTSYTLAGGTNDGIGINQGMLMNYDSSTGAFSNMRLYSAYNAPGVITHFEGITAVPGGFNLIATTDSGPGYAFVPVNVDGSFGTATWTSVALPGSSLMTGNSVYQNSVMGIYSTTNGGTIATYTGVVDQSHADSAGGLIMPVSSLDFAYSTTVAGSVGAAITGATTAGNVLGGSIGNEIITGTSSLTRPDTIYTGGGADTIILAPGHFASTRIELYAGNSIGGAPVVPGGVERAVFGSIVNASDIPQLGWWGQATAQVGGPVSNASTNAGNGNGTSLDMSTVVNFVTGTASRPVDSIDFSFGAFSNLLRTDGGTSTPELGAAVFSNLLSPGGAVTVGNADVLLLGNTFANAAAVAASLANPTTAITFAGAQTNLLNHYLVAYQDLTGSVRIADLDIHRGATPFLTTAQGESISASDMVQITGVALSSLHGGNVQFVA